MVEDSWANWYWIETARQAMALIKTTKENGYTRECLAIHVQRKLKHDDVLAVLTDLFTQYEPPEHITSYSLSTNGCYNPTTAFDSHQPKTERLKLAPSKTLTNVSFQTKLRPYAP